MYTHRDETFICSYLLWRSIRTYGNATQQKHEMPFLQMQTAGYILAFTSVVQMTTMEVMINRIMQSRSMCIEQLRYTECISWTIPSNPHITIAKIIASPSSRWRKGCFTASEAASGVTQLLCEAGGICRQPTISLVPSQHLNLQMVSNGFDLYSWQTQYSKGIMTAFEGMTGKFYYFIYQVQVHINIQSGTLCLWY